MDHKFFVWCAQQELQHYREDNRLMLGIVGLYRRLQLDEGERRVRPEEVDPSLTEEWVWNEILRQVRRLKSKVLAGELAAIDDINMISRHCSLTYEVLLLDPEWVRDQFEAYARQLYAQLAAESNPAAASKLMETRAHGNIADWGTAGPDAQELVLGALRSQAEILKAGMRVGSFKAAMQLATLLHCVSWANTKRPTGLTEQMLGVSEEEVDLAVLQVLGRKVSHTGPLN